MSEIPPPWDEYLRLQTRSSRRLKVDSYSWGMEEEMNLFLQNPEAKGLTRANASAARRERAHASLRERHAAELATKLPPALDKQLEAREALRLIKCTISPGNWSLLLKVGQGLTQAEIAEEMAMNAASMRGVVFQLRNQLQHLRPVA